MPAKEDQPNDKGGSDATTQETTPSEDSKNKEGPEEPGTIVFQ